MLTHQQKLEAIRAECIRELPDIQKLQPGCLVKSQDGTFTIVKNGLKEHLVPGTFISMGCGCCASYLQADEMEIIGREIRLADVLYYLSRNYGPDFFDNAMAVVDLWFLDRDDLNRQADITVDMIHELLKKK